MISHKKIVRILGGVSRCDHSEPVYNRLELLKFMKVPIYMCMLMLFKLRLFHSHNEWFTPYASTGFLTRLAVQNTLSVPFVRTEHSRQCINYSGPVHWNSLPSSFRSIDDFVEFKIRLERYLLDSVS